MRTVNQCLYNICLNNRFLINDVAKDIPERFQYSSVIIRPSLCGFIISMHWFMGRSSRGLIGLVTIINLLLNN